MPPKAVMPRLNKNFVTFPNGGSWERSMEWGTGTVIKMLEKSVFARVSPKKYLSSGGA